MTGNFTEQNSCPETYILYIWKQSVFAANWLKFILRNICRVKIVFNSIVYRFLLSHTARIIIPYRMQCIFSTQYTLWKGLYNNHILKKISCISWWGVMEQSVPEGVWSLATEEVVVKLHIVPEARGSLRPSSVGPGLRLPVRRWQLVSSSGSLPTSLEKTL